MVFFTNHYNAISIDRLPTKSKIRKYSVYFNNSLVCRPEVSSARKTFLFLLKMQKKKIKKKKDTSAAAVDPRQLKVEVAD